MTENTLSADEMAALAALDTPTVCNALEVVSTERRGTGFTSLPIGYVHPGVKRIVGYARTARIKSFKPHGLSPDEVRAGRMNYYDYVADGPTPSVCIIEDIDPDNVGFGALWGEVNTAIHLGLGCRGVITNGGIRDLDDCASGFQMMSGRITPSHAFTVIVDYNTEVSVFGMKVRPGDLVHADKNGAVTLTVEEARQLPKASEMLQRREILLLQAARSPGFTVEKLRRAWAEADKIK